jgi:phosphomannomutase
MTAGQKGNPEIVRFGTSGWRGRIARDFTYANVRRLAAAVALHLKQRKKICHVFAAYDTRFSARLFAAEAARVLAAHGHRVSLAAEHTPTPAVSALMRAGGWDAAVNLTASHNPAEWLGLKFTPASGAPASPEETRAIEALVPAGFAPPAATANLPLQSAKSSYFSALRRAVDFRLLRRSGMWLAVDPMHGAAVGWLSELLRAENIAFASIHDETDPLFGDVMPDPSGERLVPLAALVRKGKAAIGLAFDGDADRFGVLNEKGHPLSANLVIAMLCDYLLRGKRMKCCVLARSVVTTHLVDDVARRHGVACLETPVGFKHIGALFLEGKAGAGGEESGGFSTAEHMPEKDGLLAGLLAAEMVAAEKKPLSALVREFYRRVGGRRESGRLDVRVGGPRRLLEHGRTVRSFGSWKVERAITLDGVKWLFGGGAWMALRASGTEPLVRLYAETSSARETKKLLNHGLAWLNRHKGR